MITSGLGKEFVIEDKLAETRPTGQRGINRRRDREPGCPTGSGAVGPGNPKTENRSPKEVRSPKAESTRLHMAFCAE
jgi:hypothetical protein